MVNRWRSLVLGGLTFVVSHFVLVALWPTWFLPGGSVPVWFLNSGRGVAFTAACLFLAGLAASAGRTATLLEAVLQGCALAAGAAVAMTIVLFVIGPGNLFPIALTVGFAVATISSVMGAVAGASLKAFRSRAPS